LNNLKEAVRLIEETVGRVLKSSSIYKTSAWGNTNQSDFFNQVILIETKLLSVGLLDEVISIEKKLGRTRGEEKWMPRTIDIDILFYNDEVIDSPALKVPHPHITERKFVLVPLNEIASGFIHPLYNKSTKQLLNGCSDTLNVFICSMK
jgi:2-amino-4-hydroxy-6-hydroxymethyldihydropteridine diphosphokinase